MTETTMTETTMIKVNHQKTLLCLFLMIFNVFILGCSSSADKVTAESAGREWEELTKQTLEHIESNNYKEGLVVAEKALKIAEEKAGYAHYATASSMNNLALIYERTNKLKEALPLYKHAIAIYENTAGKNHPKTAISMNNLATLYSNLGQKELALPLLEKSLKIREATFGENNTETAESLNNLAFYYDVDGDFEKALPLYERALASYQKTLGKDNIKTAVTIANMAGMYMNMEQFEKSYQLFNESLSIVNKHNEIHPIKAIILSELSFLEFQQGNKEKSLQLIKQSHQINQQIFGDNHPETLKTKDSVAQVTKLMAK